MPVSPRAARLANLVRGSLPHRACAGAYGERQAGLDQIGQLADCTRAAHARPGASPWHGDPRRLRHLGDAMEVIGPGGSLFPALDATITPTPAGDDATMLAVCGAEGGGYSSLRPKASWPRVQPRMTGLVSRACWLKVRAERRHSRYDHTVALICSRRPS